MYLECCIPAYIVFLASTISCSLLSALPFLKSPEEMKPFSMYFTKQWQDTLFLSLHNFLSVIVQSMHILGLADFFLALLP